MQIIKLLFLVGSFVQFAYAMIYGLEFPVKRDGEISTKNVNHYNLTLSTNYYDKWEPVIRDHGDYFRTYIPQFRESMLYDGYLSNVWYSFIGSYGEYYSYYDKDMVEEMQVIADLAGVEFEDIFTYNFMYEIVAHKKSTHRMCSAILILTEYDEIIHGKNLDFLFPDQNGKMLIQFDYYDDNQKELLFSTNQVVGMVSTNSGIRYGSYTVTLNQRNKGPSYQNFAELIFGGWNIQYHIMQLLKTVDNYKDFVKEIGTKNYIAPFYLTVASANIKEGAVLIQSGRNEIVQMDFLTEENWVIVQTNSDMDEPDPDNRRTRAYDIIRKIGRNITAEQVYTQILQEFPNFNNLTIHTLMMNPQTNYYNTTVWW